MKLAFIVLPLIIFIGILEFAIIETVFKIKNFWGTILAGALGGLLVGLGTRFCYINDDIKDNKTA
jgi:hypothetical protein